MDPHPVFFSSSPACSSHRKIGKRQWRALVKASSGGWDRLMILEVAVKNSQSFPWKRWADIHCIVPQQYFHCFREASDLASILSLMDVGVLSKSSAIRINLIYCASADPLVSPWCAGHVTMEEPWHNSCAFVRNCVASCVRKTGHHQHKYIIAKKIVHVLRYQSSIQVTKIQFCFTRHSVCPGQII